MPSTLLRLSMADGLLLGARLLDVLGDHVLVGGIPVRHLTNLPSFTCQICTSPPPSWSFGVILSGGTSPPSVKFEIFSNPFLASSPVILPSGLAFSALRIASTCRAAMSTPRL